MWFITEGDLHVLWGSYLSHSPELQEGRRGDLPAPVESILQIHPNQKVPFISRAFWKASEEENALVFAMS